MDTINSRIEILLEELDLTRTGFAKELNVAPQYISKLIKKGNPSDRLIEDICRKFKISGDWLRTGKGEMKRDTSIEVETYGRFGHIMENSTPLKKNLVQMLLAIVETLPDEQWEYIYKEFKAGIERTEKEREENDQDKS